VLGGALVEEFTAVHFLVLVSDEPTVRARLAARPGSRTALARVDLHVALDDSLRRATVTPPHTMTVLDTARWTPAMTASAASAWSERLTGR